MFRAFALSTFSQGRSPSGLERSFSLPREPARLLAFRGGWSWPATPRPAPALRSLGSAFCRWPEPCQGRSRRRRWPQASLYKGPAIDDHRLPRSGGRIVFDLSSCPSTLLRIASRSAIARSGQSLMICLHSTTTKYQPTMQPTNATLLSRRGLAELQQ